jgi:hypothetical protein
MDAPLLLSPECSRPADGGGSHAKCDGLSRVSEKLASVCLCACHHAAVSPSEPPSEERAARMRADWRSGLFRQGDLARRYGVLRDIVRGVVYSGRKGI